MDDVGCLYWDLEETDVSTSFYPTDVARKEYDAKSEDATNGSDDIVEFIVANIRDKHERGWD